MKNKPLTRLASLIETWSSFETKPFFKNVWKIFYLSPERWRLMMSSG